MRSNPTLAFFYENYDSVDVSYEEAIIQEHASDSQTGSGLMPRSRSCAQIVKEAEDLLKLASDQGLPKTSGTA